MTILLAGIFLAACLFAALVNALGRAVGQTGRTRQAHLATIAAILAGMAVVTIPAPALALPAGGLLVLAGAAAAWRERGSHRILPIVPILFGVALIGGLPFAT